MAEEATKRPTKRDRTRALILSHAQDLLRSQDWADISMEQIAEEAGLVRATLFNHFETKGALLVAVADSWCEELKVTVTQADQPDRRDRVNQAIEAIIESCTEFRYLALLTWKAWTTVDSSREPLWPMFESFVAVVEVALRHSFTFKLSGRARERYGKQVLFPAELAFIIAPHILRRALAMAEGVTDYPRIIGRLVGPYIQGAGTYSTMTGTEV